MKIVFIGCCCAVLFSSCVKTFLDVKRDKSQVVPRTLDDYRAILENNAMNYFTSHLLGEIGSDDFYVLSEQWQSLADPVQRNAYVWADEIYEGAIGVDWNRGYEKMMYANFVIEGVSAIEETADNKLLRDELLGAAHFFRGSTLFQLAQLFCKPYDAQTAHGEPGLPLRTSSNINQNVTRSTLSETYAQFTADLTSAAELLPEAVLVNTRPSKAAAYGMLAKVALQLADYEEALHHADTALGITDGLIDYNDLDLTANLPFPLYGQGNAEVVFYSQMSNAVILTNTRLLVDTLLYDSYEKDDLRREALFAARPTGMTFKGFYSGIAVWPFSGLTTAELLLIRAECAARLGDVGHAVADMDRLLKNRFRSGTYKGIDPLISGDELLEKVKLERRKELLFRGVRWNDLRRYMQHDGQPIELIRNVDDQTFTLISTSAKWTWPIPPDVIAYGVVDQNER
ncbi:RagB/SusD family nutrient uptake outer membrane protein [Parapedobacter sp. DT-150]|uniref:RagB/SusD family nutrient uptake outer membrane protein n=1 Tax=Parapedobacter sp. DT-150 TaxID=3396162 RepID=UPI003F1A177B